MEPLLLPVPVAEALTAWFDAHDQAAPGVIEGLYLVGSVVLDDWTPHSDIDVVAVVADPSDPDLVGDLAAAHALVRDRVSIAIDGPYVAWGDLVVPPMAVQRPWVLDGEYHVDGESFEINPVTWYTWRPRASRFVEILLIAWVFTSTSPNGAAGSPRISTPTGEE